MAKGDPAFIAELYTCSTDDPRTRWPDVVARQWCRYMDRKCDKVRKSNSNITIGTCTVRGGVKDPTNLIICPRRFLERKQIFMDSVHLLTLHEPGNELHVIPEQSVPGGSVDYYLASARHRKVVDFLGLEVQALDTSNGKVWPDRQAFVAAKGIRVPAADIKDRGFGMNWKMSAKTILVQLLHKVETFEHLRKHLVLAVQTPFLTYMQREFSFGHVRDARLGDSMHFHAYDLIKRGQAHRLELKKRLSTDARGVAACVGMQAPPQVELEQMISSLEAAISDETLLTVPL